MNSFGKRENYFNIIPVSTSVDYMVKKKKKTTKKKTKKKAKKKSKKSCRCCR